MQTGMYFSDYAAIRKVLNTYLEGGIQGKGEVMKPAFHADAIIYGSAGGKINGGPIQGLFDAIEGAPAKELNAEITNIDIAENIAHARVESNNWNGARYSDMFLLLKENGDWKIITKVFHVHE